MAKVKKQRSTYVWKEPKWETITPSLGKRYFYEVWKAHFFVSQEMAPKTLKPLLVSHCKDVLGFSKADLSAVRSVSDRQLEVPAKWLLIEMKGGQLREEDRASALSLLRSLMDSSVSIDEPEITETTEKVKISVQEAMWNQIEPTVSLLDIAIDQRDWSVQPYRVITANEACKAAHCRLIENYFTNEYELVKEEAPQPLLSFLELIIKDCQTFIGENKVQRQRKRKPVSEDKIVAKVKFQQKDTELGLVSKLPLEMLGKEIVWFYNTKNRQLGFYEKDALLDGLTFKGTSITNVGKSGAKTLRKPEDTLKGIQKLPKTKLAKLYGSLTTKEKVPSERLGDTTVLLRGF